MCNICIYLHHMLNGKTEQELILNGASNFCKEKVYSCKIYEGTTLVRDFVPCYSTTAVTNIEGKQCPSGTSGMYDMVEGKFYTNQGGGTDFIAGPNV